jgi:hypothetical protein
MNQQQLEALEKAAEDYLATLARLASIRQCASWWPADPLMAGESMGTRCDLLVGHDGEHRHHIKGTTQTVTW